jgi:AraC-like DNA-binding protein
MNEFLSIYFYFVLSLLFFIIGANLCFKKGIVATKYLGAQYLVLTWLIFVAYFTIDARMLEYPHFFRLSTPFVYLLTPLAFLFQEFLLNPARRFRKWDLLHFLPFALNFVELIPFYFSSSEFKLAYIQEVIRQNSLHKIANNPYGWISMQSHQILRSIQFLGYSLAIIIRLWVFFKDKSAQFIQVNRLFFYWLTTSAAVKLVSVLVSIYLSFFPFMKLFSFHWVDMLKILDFIVVAVFLLINPRLLDGIILKDMVVNHLNRGDHFEETEAKKIESDLQLFTKIETNLYENQGFLQEDITLQTLSEATDIPPRKISAALKQVKNLSFPDYINSLRIQYIEEKIASDPLWSKYTFEAMAFECGFGSRSNFYQVFKRLKGVSPKTYFENLS